MTRTRYLLIVVLGPLLAALGCDDPWLRPPPELTTFLEDDDAGDDDAGDDDAGNPFVLFLQPEDGAAVQDPVVFVFETGGGVSTVELFVDGYPLQDEPIVVSPGVQQHVYDFSTVHHERVAELFGYDAGGVEVASDQVAFFPESSWIDDQPGFNHYVVQAINDWSTYPKDGTYEYCWSYYGDTCGDMWGQIWGGWYLGTHVFDGGLDCFCSGHTLEVFLDAYERWQADHGEPIDVPYGDLTLDDVDIGDFYQHWQGFGVAIYASAADAFESANIGINIYEEDWHTAMAGDFVNLSRTTGSGHSVVFVDWAYDGMTIVGLRYYGCNGSGDSHPDPGHPDNTGGNSGPGFITEYFSGHGGTVMTQYLFIGHPFDPGTL